MDTVTAAVDAPQVAGATFSTPPEAPLATPAQSFSRFDKRTRHKASRPALDGLTIAARVFVFGGGALLTAYGVNEMYGVINVGTITTLKWALLVLFAINFSWIALAFTGAIVGFISLLLAKRGQATPTSLREQTAVVMPIYNEAPARVFAAMQAMIEDVEATGLGQHYSWFFLSDTTNPDVWVAEEDAYLALRRRVGDNVRLYYRHRPKNIARKAGNIEEFLKRWGGAYEHMIVLDADSLMTGECIVTLTAAMEADADAGIIQTLPLIINRNTFFARLQQFSARLYGTVIGAGLAVWAGRHGNYWGHNAIIRCRAFASYCSMPTLSGKPPFGGHVLSHDFVEAAMMVRGGYAVYMLPSLRGSYEESPPSLIDVATRDRRWCQGNLQHLRVMTARGFSMMSRQHFAAGVFGYVNSPVWFAALIVGMLLVVQSAYIRPEYFTHEFARFPDWPRFDYERSLDLFILTMGVLLAPKALGLIYALFRAPTRKACGGAVGLVVSSILEVIFAALIAPIMMVIQTGSVLQIVFGRDTGWTPQRRDDGSIPFSDIVRRHRWHMALGFLTLVVALIISSSLAAWMSPTIAGLILAIPLSWASGKLALGMAMRRLGLLVTPEEGDRPVVAARAAQIEEEQAKDRREHMNALLAVHNDPQLREAHEKMLPPPGRRKRGEIHAERVIAEAKLIDATSIEDAVEWLAPPERMVVLHDRALIDMLTRLPKGSEAAGAAAA
ncbi:MAG: glucans biosynthesis glucosyltransferase MdoH [Beijerinckiaceae bacterium]|nr:glucans biosynthesis glucosyltransferase MdoH [Beijerinckiaceae bacterium]